MKLLVTAFIGLCVATAAAAAPPEGDLTAAKNLYASAAYEDALAMLAQIATKSPSKDVGIQVDEYRSLCLYALGRTTDAETAVKSLLEQDPLFELSRDDASPRIVAMFTDVRKRLLPSLAKERFRSARAAVDAKEFAKAESELNDLQRLVTEARQLDPDDDSLNDLATLVDGFRDLARQSQVATSPHPTPAPVATSIPTAPARPRLYTAADRNVTPPTPLAQTIPPVPIALASAVYGRHGVLELTIDTDGRVIAVLVRQSINMAYDGTLVAAARQWRYRPALSDGAPVRYVKTIAVDIKE